MKKHVTKQVKILCSVMSDPKLNMPLTHNVYCERWPSDAGIASLLG